MLPRIYTKQPFKAIYTVVFIIDKLLRLPLYAFFYAVPSLRQHGGYSYRMALLTKAYSWLFTYAGTIEMKVTRTLEPGKEGDQFVLIQPTASYPGILSQDPSVTPVPIGAVWYPTPIRTASDVHNKTVFLHIHGGAFLLGSARKPDAEFGCTRLSNNFAHAPVLAVDYRLANEPAAHFPAPLQDVVSAYRYLLHALAVPPARIVLSGDSAGGHLVIALLKYIASTPAAVLPAPAAALLWSPWVDMVDTFESANTAKDMITDPLIEWSLREVPSAVFPPEHPYLSPVREVFRTKAKVWVNVGAVERHYFRQVEFVRRMREIEGNDVVLHEMPNVGHDFFPAPTNDIDGAYVDAKKFLGERVEI